MFDNVSGDAWDGGEGTSSLSVKEGTSCWIKLDIRAPLYKKIIAMSGLCQFPSVGEKSKLSCPL